MLTYICVSCIVREPSKGCSKVNNYGGTFGKCSHDVTWPNLGSRSHIFVYLRRAFWGTHTVKEVGMATFYKRGNNGRIFKYECMWCSQLRQVRQQHNTPTVKLTISQMSCVGLTRSYSRDEAKHTWVARRRGNLLLAHAAWLPRRSCRSRRSHNRWRSVRARGHSRRAVRSERSHAIET